MHATEEQREDDDSQDHEDGDKEVAIHTRLQE
jgi:hypothetical protein